MCMYTERTQVLLTPAQKKRLELIAKQRGVSLGSLIREAVEHYSPPPQKEKEDVLEAMFKLNAPVAEWNQMEAEIAKGRLPEDLR